MSACTRCDGRTIVAYNGDANDMVDCDACVGTGDAKAQAHLAWLLSQERELPRSIKATILDLCKHVAGDSESAIFGRIVDLRKWVSER